MAYTAFRAQPKIVPPPVNYEEPMLPAANLETSISDMLHNIAEEDSRIPAEVRKFTTPRINALIEAAQKAASEFGIEPSTSTLTAASSEPMFTPLKDLATILTGFTYGTMMQLARELKSIEASTFDTPETVASFLHAWATKTLAPILPQTKPPAAPVITSGLVITTPLPPVEPIAPAPAPAEHIEPPSA